MVPGVVCCNIMLAARLTGTPLCLSEYASVFKLLNISYEYHVTLTCARKVTKSQFNVAHEAENTEVVLMNL